MSKLIPSSNTCAPCAASLLSSWARSHLLQAQRRRSSSFLGTIVGLGPLVPKGSTNRTRNPYPLTAVHGA